MLVSEFGISNCLLSGISSSQMAACWFGLAVSFSGGWVSWVVGISTSVGVVVGSVLAVGDCWVVLGLGLACVDVRLGLG